MINGAVTLGTLDGANVEIYESVGEENILLFGMTTPEVNSLKAAGYNPRCFVDNNPMIRRALEEMKAGFRSYSFQDIMNSLLRWTLTWCWLTSIPTTKSIGKDRNACIKIHWSGTRCVCITLQRQDGLRQTPCDPRICPRTFRSATPIPEEKPPVKAAPAKSAPAIGKESAAKVSQHNRMPAALVPAKRAKEISWTPDCFSVFS